MKNDHRGWLDWLEWLGLIRRGKRRGWSREDRWELARLMLVLLIVSLFDSRSWSFPRRLAVTILIGIPVVVLMDILRWWWRERRNW